MSYLLYVLVYQFIVCVCIGTDVKITACIRQEETTARYGN